MEMIHIAIAEALDGKIVDWMEQVGDEQYQAGMSNKAVRPLAKRKEKVQCKSVN